MSLDDKIGSHNAPSRALYESHTHYRGSDPCSVTVVDREAPPSDSSGNLWRGPWGERHPSSVGPASGPEGHYADTAVVVLHDGSSQSGAVKADKTLARSTAAATYSHNTMKVPRRRLQVRIMRSLLRHARPVEKI